MARETITRFTDDIDGSDLTNVDNPTMTFTIDNVQYEIDLSAKNRDKFAKAVAPYIDAARKTGSTGRARTSSRRKSTAQAANGTPAEIRAWAQSQGLEVPTRGRIPQEIREAFEAAN